MTAQIIDLSNYSVFKYYQRLYKYPDLTYQKGFLGLEVRGMNSVLFNDLKNDKVYGNVKCFTYGDALVNVMFTANLYSLRLLAEQTGASEYSFLAEDITAAVNNFYEYENKPVNLHSGLNGKNRHFIMGILNVTPDSFSDGGKFFDKDLAVEHAFKMIEDGADIIDVGGESTRPGSKPVSADEEIERTIPVIEALAKENSVTISIDTTKHQVAEAALEKGASIVNDISGGTFDEEILETTSKFDAGYIIMHTTDKPETMQSSIKYNNLVADIYDFLSVQSEKARRAGLKKIVVDPGIGFGKAVGHNYELLNRIPDFKSLGYPVMIGLSRKSFIGKTLDLPAEERDTATVIMETAAMLRGARMIRTHNVKNAVQSLTILDKFLNYNNV